MLKEAPVVILPLFKPDHDLFKPTSISSFNSVSSIWCVIQNMFLAATYEGYACSMRIPVGDEGKNVVESIGAPSEYLLPCYIGIGKAKKMNLKSVKNKLIGKRKSILANGKIIKKCFVVSFNYYMD